MKAKHIFFPAFMLMSLLVFGQNPHLEFKYAIGVANVSSLNYESVQDKNGNLIGGLGLNIFKVAPTLTLGSSKGHLTEFTLMGLNGSVGPQSYVAGSNFSYRPTSFNFSGTVGRYYAIFRASKSRLVPMVGAQFNTTVSKSNLVRTLQPGAYPNSILNLNLDARLAVKVAWFATDHLFFDATASASLASLSYFKFKTENPNPSNGLSKASGTSLGLLGQPINLQLGVGFKF